jgi:multiple sugar transport system ATP-binding protein
MTLGHRVAVMRDGRILQVDSPQRLYEEPGDLFVAGFIGSPAMNLLEARISDDEVVFGRYRIPLDPRRRPPGDSSGGSLVLGIRPESFEDAAFGGSELPTIDVEVAVLEELGSDAHVFFEVDAPRIGGQSLEAAEDADAAFASDESPLVTARVDARTAARVGSSLRLAVDPSRFHFFDADTGASLLGSRPVERPEPAPVG